MKLSTPRWWYSRSRRGTGGVVRLLLTPVGWIWAAVTARRIARGRPVPVICVGNLTVGGTGKTPVVHEIARRLGAAVLSRGYGGAEPGPLRVDAVRHSSADVGDEPLMLASDLAVWVSRDRAAGAVAAAQDGARIIVMDDGHQNPSVKKTLSLIVVDGETRGEEWPFGAGGVFPSGPMREPLKVGLARADAVVLLLPADLAEPDPELVGLFSPLPVLIAHLVPASPPPSGPQVGFAGVGKPWKVERAWQAAGCQLAASCDLVVAASNAVFGTPGVKIGLFCSTPMVALSRAVGRKRSMQMLLTGQTIDADTAADWGLVNFVVAPEDLDREVRELAAKITTASPLTVKIGKQAFYRQIDLPQAQAYEAMAETMATNAVTCDAQEGMQAFVDKRKPEWRNK